jgi:hypothetical protein
MSGAELVIDLVVSDQQAKFASNPKGYQAPTGLGALDVGLAAAMGPAGVAQLAGFLGPTGFENVAAQTAQLGGKAAEDAATTLAIADAQGIRKGEHLTARDLHGLAALIRNPKLSWQLRQAAVRKLSELAHGTGALATAAAKELDKLVADLNGLGQQGARALGWIASLPGEAATKAISALADLANRGLKLGFDTLAGIASHPGQSAAMAKHALVDIASKGGQFAKSAYDKLLALGDDGIELTKAVARNLAADKKKAVDMLAYVVAHPGAAGAEVGRIALNGLKDIAKDDGDDAKAATRAILGFVKNGNKDAVDTVKSLWSEGSADTKRIVAAVANDLGGLKEVLGGLTDVASALGDAGVGAAKRAVGWVGNLFG